MSARFSLAGLMSVADRGAHRPGSIMAETAVFLDRDGTIIEDVGYLADADGLVIFAEAIEAVQALRESGMKVVVVTNQSGVARGLIRERVLEEIHDNLRAAFRHQGAPLDAIYFCPHHPKAKLDRYRRHCDCRKPEPGMLRRAAEALTIDLGRSYMVGDKIDDVVAGHRAGCQSVLVRTGAGRQSARRLEQQADSIPAARRPEAIAADVREAADWILKDRAARLRE